MDRFAEFTEKYITAENLPISFFYGDKKIAGMPKETNPKMTVTEKGNLTQSTFVSNLDGIEITSVVTTYKDYPVYEIVSYLENKSGKNTEIIRDFKGFDGQLSFKDINMFDGLEPILYSNSGDYFSPNGYETRKEFYANQMWTKYTPQGGRPCDQAFPYFKVQFLDYGLNIAIGWPAQWSAEFAANLKGVAMKAGQEITQLYLEPNEKIRTPKVTVMVYEGDYDFGTNMWRRWYMAHILPKPNGKDIQPHITTSYNAGGEEFTKSTEENQIEHIRLAAKSPVPFSVWWIDAGWYDCHYENGEDHWVKTGNWYACPRRYPNGLKPVSDELHKNNMQLLVWFEPERVRRNTDFALKHPEWLLECDNIDDGEWGIARNCLLNLGNDECRIWLTDMICNLIKEYGIDVYRQDFNFPPLRYWRENEAFDRQGINENKYVQGYLAYWDALLERNPGLWIDSCSSGGRRNDLETLRRSVPLHPTDYGYGYHPVCQDFSRTLDSWIPYYKTACSSWDKDGEYTPYDKLESKPADTFSRISSFSPLWPAGFDYEPSDEDMKLIKAWEKAMPTHLYGDFYPISEPSRKDSNFFVNEYIDKDGNEGYIQAVRNIKCEQESYKVFLKAVNKGTYIFTNPLTDEAIEVENPADKGFEIKLEKRQGAIWFFKKK